MNLKIGYMLLFLLIPLTTVSFIEPETRPVFISLGIDCEAACSLRYFKLRQQAYPFDWLVTLSFSDICTLLANEFADFLNPLYLSYDGKAVVQTKYNIIFNHDFPSDPLAPGYAVIQEPQENAYQLYSGHINANYLDHLNEVIEKYTRRINRLLTLLNAKSTIIFFRTRGTPEEAKQFVQLMETQYPLVDYRLLVTYNDPSLDYDWNIPHVTHYHRHAPSLGIDPEWMHADEWPCILSHLGFEKWKIE